MANRKFLIESILGLAQKIGANPNKFMGTKTNINFLGTGDKGMKGTTFSGQINDDFLNLGFGKDDMIKIIEQDAGYVSAGKLNDSQLNTMFNNLKMIDETFSPPPGPLNVIDLETGTRGINKEGLESLRETDKIKRFTEGKRTSKTAISDKIKEGIESLKNKLTRDYGGDEIATKATSENNFIRSGAADFSDFVSAEGGRRAVVRQLMKNNANYFGLPPEMAESIAKSKDLGKGGSNFPDPLVVFRNAGNFTTDELNKIDDIIEANPFDDVKVIADKVSDYVQSIRPDGFTSAFAEGGSVTTPKRGLVNEAGSYAGNRRKKERPSDVVDSRLLDIGFDNMSSEEIKDLIKAASTYRTGGRVGFKSGKFVKDGIAALLKLGNKEFGKDTIKIADEIDRPASALLRDEFASFNERTAIPAMEGSFTKAEVVIERMKNSLKNALGKTDADSKYVKETFPNMIKELEAKPELGNNPNVWKMFSEDMPKNQRLVVHSDDSVSFFQQTERGPQNIKSAMKFAEENNISVKEASRILKMEPEDQILEITRLKATRQMKKGGLAQILEM